MSSTTSGFSPRWQLGQWRNGFKGSPERGKKGSHSLPGTNRKESWSSQLSSSCQSQQAHCSLLVSVVGSPISWWGLQLSLLIRYHWTPVRAKEPWDGAESPLALSQWSAHHGLQYGSAPPLP